MRERLREVDANLLLSLHALLEERNLTHAGERMTMSQPAMSGALARLRKHFDDELLVRSGRGFELTPLAEEIRPLVAEAVEAAEALLGNQRDFDARSSGKRFAVSMSEYAMTVLAEPLTRAIAEHAPGCTMALDPIDVRSDQFEAQLMRRDLIVGPLGYDLPGRIQPVFTDELVCLVTADHPRLRDGALTLEDLQAMPHAVAHFAAAGPRRRPLEIELETKGIENRNRPGPGHEPAHPAVRRGRHGHVRVRPVEAGPPLPGDTRPDDRRHPARPGDDHRGRTLARAPRDGPRSGVAAPAALRRGHRARGRARLSQRHTARDEPERRGHGHHHRGHQRRLLAAQPDQR